MVKKNLKHESIVLVFQSIRRLAPSAMYDFQKSKTGPIV